MKYGVWVHVGLYQERQGWAKGGKDLSFAEAQAKAENLRRQDITAYVKPMPEDGFERRSRLIAEGMDIGEKRRGRVR